MPQMVYQLRHMFQGLREGQTVPTFFTRDNEHLLAELPEKVLKEAEAKQWITATAVPTLREMKESVKSEEDGHARHRKGTSK